MSLALLRKLGVYIEEDFFTGAFCRQIKESMTQVEPTEALVFDEDKDEERLELQLRKTDYSEPSPELKTRVEDNIRSRKARLEEHFGEEFNEFFEPPKFLIYRPGDYFAPHVDSQAGRRINMTICLNDHSDEETEGCHVGGDLLIYGLVDHPKWRNKGVRVPGKTGLFVAYRSELVHEVPEILWGERFAIVSRFLSADRVYEQHS